jgi:glycosyltransferase involved in cell wall biosynthesis
MIDLYVAGTEFNRRKFIQGGLPAHKIVVKPNFVHPDPGAGTGSGGFALFVARLTEEKGVETLIRAWDRLAAPIPLTIVGDGPLEPTVRNWASSRRDVRFLGAIPHAEMIALMKLASFLVFPSTWYEGCNRTVIEAFACGLPVIASDVGSIRELVEHGRMGLRFSAGDPGALASAARELNEDVGLAARLRRNARAEYEAKYTAEANYPQLIRIYEEAIRRFKRPANGPATAPPAPARPSPAPDTSAGE